MRVGAVCSMVLAGAALAFSQQGLTDHQFIEKAAQLNMTEAHLGKLAQQHAASDAVKQHGQKMEADHTAAYQKLTRVANDKAVNVPKAISGEHQSKIQQFENLRGEAFDREYGQKMVESHQKAIDLFQQASNQAQSPELKSYASEMLPDLRAHLESAKALAGGATVSGVQQTKPGQTAQHDQNQTAALNLPQTAATAGVHNQEARQNGATDATLDGQSRTRTMDAVHSDSMVHYGTVTAFEPGKSLELKIRDRAGRHIYSLNESGATAHVPADVKVGSTVVVHETTDRNGHHTIRVDMDSEANRN